MTSTSENPRKAWRDIGMEYFHPRVMAMLFLGFSAGVPILLIFSSLGLWLREAGVDRSTVTMFSWAALPYSFKFIWAPLVDRISIPLLTPMLGRRRAWLLISQLLIITAILWMAFIDPSVGGSALIIMASATLLLGFSSATQDIVIDAYRIEVTNPEVQAVTSSTYIAGYRIGMIVAGAGALFLASFGGSTTNNYQYGAWLWAYQAMALVMVIGVITTLVIPEPTKFKQMSLKLSMGYLLIVVMLIFIANELAYVLSDSHNSYYSNFVWFVRVLFLTVGFVLVNRLSKTRFDHLALAIWAILVLLLLGTIMIQNNFIDYNVSNLHWYWVAILLAVITYIAFYIRHRVADVQVKEALVESEYSTVDYVGFFAMFKLALFGFIALYFFTSDGVSLLMNWEVYKTSSLFASVVNSLSMIPESIGHFKDYMTELSGNKSLSSFVVGTLRLLTALGIAVGIGYMMTKSRWVNTEMVDKTYVAPIRDFFIRFGVSLAVLLLALIGLYRISDIVLGVIANVFYQDLGFTKVQIASIVKTFGLVMTIAGGFLGGILALRYGVMRILFLGAVLTVLTNLLFVMLAKMNVADPDMLYLVISADNLTAGLASAAFIAFLSSLTNIKFTAVQYAIFSSLMSLLPKVIGGSSGSIVDSFCPKDVGALSHCMVGYENFFLIASVMGIPVLLLVWIANKHLTLAKFELKN